jgi:hypothetical protein
LGPGIDGIAWPGGCELTDPGGCGTDGYRVSRGSTGLVQRRRDWTRNQMSQALDAACLCPLVDVSLR